MQAQPTDLLQAEVSIFKDGPFATGSTQELKARATYIFQVNQSVSEVALNATALRVSGVKLREGRLKAPLDFTHSESVLTITLPEKAREKVNVEIEYIIDMDDPEMELFVQSTEGVLAFNSMNANVGKPMGRVGMFFPAIAGDPFVMKLNVSTDENENIGFPGFEEYKVSFDGGMAHFWKSKGTLLPESFYLIIGTFEEFDAEEIEEEFMLGEIVLKQMKFEKSKRSVSPYMQLYGLEVNSIADSEYAIVDSLSKKDFSSYFLQPGDLPKVTEEQYKKEAAIALYLSDEEEEEASQKHESAYRKKYGDTWWQSRMNEKWKNRKQLSQNHLEKVLTYRLMQYRKHNPQYMAAIGSAELDTGLIKLVMDTREMPSVSFSYRYISGDTALYVSYKQDTAVTPVYHFPVRIAIVAGEMKDTAWRVVRQPEGRFKVHFERAPNMASIGVGHYFVGTIHDNKPDTYNLYQLSNAKTKDEREEALMGLFETSNPNLFSTALGIAMDDENPEIRSKAIAYATDMNAAAQRKLKDTLINLSKNDPNAEVREKADVLVKKYYETK